MVRYQFDGTYAGYLSGLFECFERKEWDAAPVSAQMGGLELFGEVRTVVTGLTKAKRVHVGLVQRVGTEKASHFWRNFLSEDAAAWRAGYRVAQQIFLAGPQVLENHGDSDVLFFLQTLKKVSRERHRMTAFVRFAKTATGLYVATIEPDFNVLPLVVKFFRQRYADQPWLIFDAKRDYGMHYDGNSVTEVVRAAADGSSENPNGLVLAWDGRNEQVERLWKQYFKSTNIEARRNMRLHLRHLPKRYWKYLVEKQP